MQAFGWLVFGILAVLAGALAAAQTALTSLDRGSLRRVLPRLHGDATRLVSASVVAHVLLMLAAAVDGGALALRAGQAAGMPATVAVPLFGLGVVAVLLAIGEFLPRHFARGRPEGIARVAAVPLAWIAPPLSPLLSLSTSVTRGVLSLFGLRPVAEAPLVTEEELSHYIALGERAGVLERREREMLHSVLRFTDTLVRQVMVPRTEMFCVDVDQPLDVLVDKLAQSGYSRAPVVRGHMDNIVGILYAKDLIPIVNNRELIVLQDLLRKPVFVPETMRVSDLLKEFQRGKLHLAIAVDEYGGTAGLVTLEDLLEEIVGEIRDEYDMEEAAPEVSEDGSYLVDGKMELSQLRSLLRLEIPEPPAGASTVAGLIVANSGEIPTDRLGVVIGPVRFVVEEVAGDQIRRVRVVPVAVPGGELPLPPTEKTEEVAPEPAQTPAPARARTSKVTGTKRRGKTRSPARGSNPSPAEGKTRLPKNAQRGQSRRAAAPASVSADAD